MDGDIEVVISARCPSWEVPVDCAVKLAKSGDQNLQVQTNGMAYCSNCGIEFVVDGYVREHAYVKDKLTGFKTEFGAQLKKTGKQRNRQESFNRLSYLCNTILGLEQNVSMVASQILQKLMDSGASKGGRGFVVLEVVAAYTAARISNQSVKLENVIDSHRGWTTAEGEYRAIKSVSPKAVRRLIVEQQRQGTIPTIRPMASDLIRNNRWCLENLSDEVISTAQELTKGVSGSPDSIAAAAIVMACGNSRVIAPGNIYFKDTTTGRENDGQRMTLAVAAQLFSGTSARTIRKRMKEIRENQGISVLSNPVEDSRKQVIKGRLKEVVSELGGELDPDKPPFGITRKDVEVLERIKNR